MPQSPMTTLGIAASVSIKEVTGARSARGASSLRNRAAPIASGVARASAQNDVMAVPNRKLAAPKASRPTTGFHTACVMKCRPYLAIAGRAPSTTFHAIKKTSTVAAAAASPAMSCRSKSPKRTRRPVKGRRVASGVSSAEDTRSLALDLLDRLLCDDEDTLRNRDEPEGRRVFALLSVRHSPEEELLQVGRLARLERHDHVGVRRDRIGERILLWGVHDRERVRRRGRLHV